MSMGIALHSVGPAWTQGKIEKPQGTKDMGGWTKSLYTPEQQKRLQVDEDGKHNKVLPDGAYTMQQKVNMRFLDAYEVGEAALAVTRLAQGNDSQVWLFKADESGLYTIQQKNTKRFLDAELEKEYHAVTREAPSGTEKWVIKSIGDGAYTIQQEEKMYFLDAFEDEKNDFKACTRTDQKNDSQKWVIKTIEAAVKPPEKKAPIFVLIPEAYLQGGNEISKGEMTLDEAKVAASVEDAIGFTWKGDKNPKGKVTVYVKNSKCPRETATGAGWYTMLKPPEKKAPMFVLIPEAFLPGGNEISQGEMTLDEAKAAASVEDAIGFTWKGDKNPKGKVTVYVKNSKCPRDTTPGAGWYTMLKHDPDEPSAKKPRKE